MEKLNVTSDYAIPKPVQHKDSEAFLDYLINQLVLDGEENLFICIDIKINISCILYIKINKYAIEKCNK